MRVGSAKAKARQQSAIGQAVEGGKLFRQHHRIVSGQHHHAHTDLQSLGAACSECHCDERVGDLAADAVAEPQAVEAKSFESIDGHAEAAVVERGARTKSEPDANFQLDSSVVLWLSTRNAFENIGGSARH